MNRPPPISESWLLTEEPRRFEFGNVLSAVVTDLLLPTYVGELRIAHAGLWECDLRDDSLIWSGGVYDIFGLPRRAKISRAEVLALYREESRAALQRLRSHAIRHGVGFTLDAEIRPVTGGTRWLRLIAAPVFENGRAVRLHGLKLLV